MVALPDTGRISFGKELGSEECDGRHQVGWPLRIEPSLKDETARLRSSGEVWFVNHRRKTLEHGRARQHAVQQRNHPFPHISSVLPRNHGFSKLLPEGLQLIDFVSAFRRIFPLVLERPSLMWIHESSGLEPAQKPRKVGQKLGRLAVEGRTSVQKIESRMVADEEESVNPRRTGRDGRHREWFGSQGLFGRHHFSVE